MRLPIYQIDAFTAERFRGNPAAVVPLREWLPDETLLNIAAENNLSETAFFTPGAKGDDFHYHLRWFTPTVEVDLCGHATLATGFLLRSHLGETAERITFHSRSGPLHVSYEDDLVVLDFPATPSESMAMPCALIDALGGAEPVELRCITQGPRANGYSMAVFDDPRIVANLKPDFRALATIGGGWLVATAPSAREPGRPRPGPERGRPGSHRSAPATTRQPDFISRFFAPGSGIDEDPCTGSAHCMSAPYWAKRLGKSDLLAHQISKRGGEVHCRVRQDRVHLAGRAVTYLIGEITID